MGYTGRILVARTGGAYAGGDVPVLWEDERGDGWRWIQLDGDARGALSDLVTATGMPVIAAFILDSDVADVEGLTPAGRGWHTYLHPHIAEEFGAPELPQSADEVLAAALDWSAAAGLTADPGAVRGALEAQGVEVEDVLSDLVKALGVPAAH
jgi:hypothetical protein